MLDFCTFFDVFSKLISKRVSKGEKIGQKSENDAADANWGPDSGGPQAPGER